MKTKDIIIGIVVGIITGFIWTGIFLRLGTLDFLELGNAIWLIPILVPLIFVFGLYLGNWLSRSWHFFNSFARFVSVGFMNAGIDFGVFNLLMFWTGVEMGINVSLFKAVSFVAAVINSYFWNKKWVFEADNSRPEVKEFFTFLAITLVGLVINVGITSIVIFAFPPQFELSQLAWNNVAAVFGTVFGLIWNFIGYRLIVFKKEA